MTRTRITDRLNATDLAMIILAAVALVGLSIALA